MVCYCHRHTRAGHPAGLLFPTLPLYILQPGTWGKHVQEEISHGQGQQTESNEKDLGVVKPERPHSARRD